MMFRLYPKFVVPLYANSPEFIAQHVNLKVL